MYFRFFSTPLRMNILKPDLVWVEGRCFRKLPIKDEDTKPVEESTKTSIKI